MLAQIPAPVVSDALSCNTTGKNRGCPRVQRIDVESAPSPTVPVVCAESKTPCYGGYWDTVGNSCLGYVGNSCFRICWARDPYSGNRTRDQSIHGSNCSLSKSMEEPLAVIDIDPRRRRHGLEHKHTHRNGHNLIG